MQSILERAKAAAKKAEELDDYQEESEDSFDDGEDIPVMEKEFKFFGKKWVEAPRMDEILEGDYSQIPIECLLTHYILRCNFSCYYIALENDETGDEFEISEFDWLADNHHDHDHEEIKKPWEENIEFRLYKDMVTASECGQFLVGKIKEGYHIFIEERKEFETILEKQAKSA